MGECDGKLAADDESTLGGDDEEPRAPERERWYEEERAKVQGLTAEAAATVLQAIEEKRHYLDQMMWQVPTLSLTAQAFLLTIGLGSETSWLGRLTAAFLGLVAAGAAIQLLLKHRYHEELHARWLEQFTKARTWPILAPGQSEAFAYEGKEHSWKRGDQWRARLRWRVAKPPSPYVWIVALALFGMGDLSIFIAALVRVSLGTDLLG